MYISINGKFFDKHRAKAKQLSIDERGEGEQKENDSLLWEELETSIDNLEITEDEINIGMNNDLGYFSISIPLDSSIVEQILEVTIKKMNKIKSLIQNLK